MRGLAGHAERASPILRDTRGETRSRTSRSERHQIHMTFIDRIADARDIADVFDLVNEFIVGLHHVHQLQEIPVALRPGRVATADDLAFWLNLLSEEIRQRDAVGDEIPDVMFALHAVLETALQRLRSDWYH